MAYTDFIELVQKCYIAYYQRPGDPAGLKFWADYLDQGNDFYAMIDAFGTSDESRGLYGEINEDTIGDVIDSIYMGLFDRLPDEAGKQWYVDAFIAGEYPDGRPATPAGIALDILNGAQNADSIAIMNKVSYSDCFVSILDPDGDYAPDENGHYEASYYGGGDAAAARSLLAGVTAAPGSLPDCNLIRQQIIENIANPGDPILASDAYFTLTEAWEPGTEPTQGSPGTPPTYADVVMWGYAPNGIEGSGNGVPLADLINFLETITGVDLHELGLIDIDGNFTEQVGSITIENLTLDGNASTFGDLGGTGQQTVTNGDQMVTFLTPSGDTCCQFEAHLGDAYLEFLHNLLFDADGNSLLHTERVLVDPGTPSIPGKPGTEPTQVPIVLTPTENNGGTLEEGFTSSLDDMIVAGRLELLHQAYIDAGAGYDILEIDAKGVYAQPYQLLGIEEVRVQNLPNVYTGMKTLYTFTSKSGAVVTQSDYPEADEMYYPNAWRGDGTFESNTDPNARVQELDYSTYPDSVEALAVPAGSRSSLVDLSRASDIQRLVVTEGNWAAASRSARSGSGQVGGDDLGALTIVGIRNGAEAVLEGDFTKTVTLQYGQGLGEGLNLILNLGDNDDDGVNLNVIHNADTLNLTSTGGGNTLKSGSYLGGYLSTLNVLGGAHLNVSDSLKDTFHSGHRATIDASRNTAGVDLSLDGFDDEVVFVGNEAAGSRFSAVGSGSVTPEAVTISGGDGGNEFFAEAAGGVSITSGAGADKLQVWGAEEAVITAGNGSDEIYAKNVTDELRISAGQDDDEIQVAGQSGLDRAEIAAGDGANQIAIASAISELRLTAGAGADEVGVSGRIDQAEIALGDGANDIELAEIDDSLNLTAGAGDDIVNVQKSTGGVTIDVGDGANRVAVMASGGDSIYPSFVDITTGAGDDDIAVIKSGSATEPCPEGEAITIAAGDGDNQVCVDGDRIKVTAGAGDDTLHVFRPTGTELSETLLQADLGSGADLVTLGGDNGWSGNGDAAGLMTLEGSFIRGDDVTLAVYADSDLVQADLTGITRVELRDADSANAARPELVLTGAQFKEIGAANFTIPNSYSSGDTAVIRLVIQQDTTLADLNVDALDPHIDLIFDVQGATLTLSARELHEKVMPMGINVSRDLNGAWGQVVVTDAGMNFDPFDDDGVTGNAEVYGTLNDGTGNDAHEGGFIGDGDVRQNYTVIRTFDGFERPTPIPAANTWTVDSSAYGAAMTITDAMVNDGPDTGSGADRIISQAEKLEILGDYDVTFADPVQLADNFVVDFTGLSGKLDLTLAHFENVKAISGNGTDADAARINVEIADHSAAGGSGMYKGIVTSGLQTLIVTDIYGADPGCSDPDCTTDAGEADIYLCDNSYGLTTVGLQGAWNDTINFHQLSWATSILLEGDGSAGYTYKANGDPRYSNIGTLHADYCWNGAPAQVDITNQGVSTLRPLHVEGLDIDNAESITITVSDSDDLILDALGGNAVEELHFTAAGDVTVINGGVMETLDPNNDVHLRLVDASGVGGDFNFEMKCNDYALDFTDVELIGVDGLALDRKDAAAKLTVDQYLAMGGSGSVTLGADSAFLTLTGLSDQAFASSDFAEAINLRVEMGTGASTLNADTDLSGVDCFVVGSGAEVTLTAAQALELKNASFDGGGEVHITGVDQAALDAGLAAIVGRMNSSTSGSCSADMTGDLEIVDDVTLTASELNATAVGGFKIKGNNDPDLRVNIVMDEANRTTVNNESYNIIGTGCIKGISSTGIPTYVVTKLDPQAEDIIYICNNTEDLKTLGLQENGGDSIHFIGMTRPEDGNPFYFIMEGDGFADWNEVEKIDTTWNQSNIGTLVADFYTEQNPEAVVDIGNQGVLLGAASDGGERVLQVDGVRIYDTKKVTINVADGDACIHELDFGTGSTTCATPPGGGGDCCDGDFTLGYDVDLVLNAVEDLEICNALPEVLGSINATGVAGEFTATINDDDISITTGADATLILQDVGCDGNCGDECGTPAAGEIAIDGTAGTLDLVIGGDSNLSAANLLGVDGIAITEGKELTLSADQVAAIDEANIASATPGNANNQEVLNINGLGEQLIAKSELGSDVVLGNVCMAAGSHTLNPGTDLTGAHLYVPAGGELTLTAAQYMQLADLDGLGGGATIHITGLTQAEVDAGFDLSNISNATGDVTLAEDIDLRDASGTPTDLNNFGIIMEDGQTLILRSWTQADGRAINGTAGTTTVKYGFDTLTASETDAGGDGVIDASGYQVTELWSLNTFFQEDSNQNGIDLAEYNAEYIINNLSGDVTLVIYYDPAVTDTVSDYNRFVRIEPDTTVAGDLVFNDIDTSRELRNLGLTFSGNSHIAGDLRLPTIDYGAGFGSSVDYFDTLTINSVGTGANSISGDITAAAVAAANPSTATEAENNLLQVIVAADTDFSAGTLNFSSNDAGMPASASLSLTGSGAVTFHSLDITDDNSYGSGVSGAGDIRLLSIDNDLAGGLTVTGGSAAIAAGEAEGLIFSGAGDITLGTQDEGVIGSNLSTFDASGMTGNLVTGAVADVDSQVFAFTAGSGVTTFTLTDAELNAGNDGWKFDFTRAAAGSTFDLSGLACDDGGTLDIDLGANTTLIINEDTNLSNLTLSITQTQAIQVYDGVTLTLTASQASGLNIVGVDSDGDGLIEGRVNIVDLGTGAYDLSGIDAAIAGTAYLGGCDAGAADCGPLDVTLDAATDLGAFSVTLCDADTASGSDSRAMGGQTIRFQTVAQAERDIIVPSENDSGSAVDTNVVWLFDSISARVNTNGYSPNLGRVWFTPELVTNAADHNVEQLFTSLPEQILRVEFSSLEELDILLTSSEVDRTIELVSFTNLPDGLLFSDEEDRLEHVHSLDVQMGGQVVVGDIMIDNLINPPAGVADVAFSTLTLTSRRALSSDYYLAPEQFKNDNDGVDESGEHYQPAAINQVGDIGVGSLGGLDLTDVLIDTGDVVDAGGGDAGGGAALAAGTITYSSVNSSNAQLRLTGGDSSAGGYDVDLVAIDTSDADINELDIIDSSYGELNVSGASPALVLDNTETLSIYTSNAMADDCWKIEFGTAGSGTRPGIVGEDLSTIRVFGEGSVDLGLISAIDSSIFMLDATVSNGNVRAVLGADDLGHIPTLQDGGTWVFDADAAGNANLAGRICLTITDDVVLGAGTLVLDDVLLTINGNVDFTTLAELDIDSNDVVIEVPAGSSLTLLAADATGLEIIGDGTVTVKQLEALGNASGQISAEFSGIFTSSCAAGNDCDCLTRDGDLGTLEVEVATSAAQDLQFSSGSLGKAHVTISGDGTFDMSACNGVGMDVTYDSDCDGTGEEHMATFTVGSDATLKLDSDQIDDRVVDGAGTTELNLCTAPDDVNLSGITTTGGVNASVDCDEDFNCAADFGSATIAVGDGDTLSVVGGTVDGLTVTGTGGTILIDDCDLDGDGADDPIAADFSNFTIGTIAFVGIDSCDGTALTTPAALLGSVVFPTLYGDPAGIGPVQTVELTAQQANGQSITGIDTDSDGNIDTGRVTVTHAEVDSDGDGVGDAYNLSGITAAAMTAHVEDNVVLNGATDLGTFAVVVGDCDGTQETFAFGLSAAQADGLSLRDEYTAGSQAGSEDKANITVSDLEDTADADLSGIQVYHSPWGACLNYDKTEIAKLDAEGDVTLTGNLGQYLVVEVSDSDSGGATTANTMTFAGAMDSPTTVFEFWANNLTMVFDAADASELRVTDANNPVTAQAEIDTLTFTGNMTGGTISARVGGVVVTAGFDTDEDTTLAALGANIVAEMANQGYAGATAAVTAGSDTIVITGAASGADMPAITDLDVSAASGYTAATVTDTQEPAEPHSTVIINNLGSGLVNFSCIDALTVTANVPTSVTLDPNSVLNAFNGNTNIVLAEGVELGLTTAQLQAVGEEDFSGTAGGVTETLVVSDYNGQAIDSSALGADVEIAQLVVLDTNAVVDMSNCGGANADLSKVHEVYIPEGTTLTMSADQYQELTEGAIAGTVTGSGTLNLVCFDSDNTGIDMSHVAASVHAGTITLDTADIDGIVLGTGAVLDDAGAEPFSIVFSADDQTFTFSSETQAEGSDTATWGGRAVNGSAADNEIAILGFESADGSDGDAVIECGNYDVENVWVLNSYLYNEFGISSTPANFEFFLNDLSDTVSETSGDHVLVTVYDNDTLLGSGLVTPGAVSSTSRWVVIDSNTYVDASIAFSDLDPANEVTYLNLEFQGNSVVNGDLQLPQNLDPHSTNPVTEPNLFGELDIISRDETGSLTSPNQLTGGIFADDGSAGESVVEVFTLTLDDTINIVGSEDQIGFDGIVVNLADGDDADAIGARLAGTTWQNWSAEYDAATNVVTFSNRNVGDVTDITLGDFTFNQNGGSSVLPGPTTAVAKVTDGAFNASENNLFDVDIDVDHDLVIGGQLRMSYVTRSDNSDAATHDAYLDISGTGDITIGSVDTSDIHIPTLHYTHSGSGHVTAPGTSPAFALDNTEVLHIVESGSLSLGTAGDSSKPGIAGNHLSRIDVDITAGIVGSGIVDLGLISDIDGDGDNEYAYNYMRCGTMYNSVDFVLDTAGAEAAGSGSVIATLGADDSGAPALGSGAVWAFGSPNATDDANALNLTIDGATTFGSGTLVFEDVNLSLQGAVDWSDLTGLCLTDTDILVPAGASLTLTWAQAHNLFDAGVRVVGDGTVHIVGAENDLSITDGAGNGTGIGTTHIDLSGLTGHNGQVNLDVSAWNGGNQAFDITGSDFADSITSGSGDDTIASGSGADTVTAGGGNDSLSGGSGDDVLWGGGQSDQTGGGSDTFAGGAGDDTIHADGGDSINGGAGDDTAVFGSDVVSGTGGGQLSDDDLQNVEHIGLNGGAGSKTYDFGAQTEDLEISSTSGTAGETIYGGAGADTINAGDGNDSIFGNGGSDQLYGGDGNDTLTGGDGGSGCDNVADTFHVDSGIDQITDLNGTGSAADILDVVAAATANATVCGSWVAGSGTVNNGTANLTVADGVSLVDLSASGGTSGYTINNTGNGSGASLTGSVNADTIQASNHGDTIHGGTGDDSLVGGTEADSLYGDTGDDHIAGGSGADSLYSGAGNDVLEGGAGADLFTIDGGTGNEITDISGTGSGADSVVVNSGAGLGTGRVTDNWVAGTGTANNGTASLFIGGTGVIEVNICAETGSNGYTIDNSGNNFAASITGSRHADTITASDHGDTIHGCSGGDSIVGGAGADSLYGDTGDDTLTGSGGNDAFYVADGTDSITDLNGGDDLVVLAGATANGTVTGNWTSGSASSNNGTANLSVSDGVATVNVSSFGGTGGVTIDDSGNSTATSITGTDNADTITGGSAGDTIDGGSGADSLVGGSGADSLIGGPGNDTLAGGTGNDILTGGAGADYFNIDYGTDTASDLSGSGAGADILEVCAGAHGTGVITGDWTVGSGTAIAATGSAALTMNGATSVDLSAAAGAVGFDITTSNTASTVIGSQWADTLTGGTSNDVLTGGSGDDVLTGGAGNDTFNVDFGTDTITDLAGSDILVVSAGATAAATVSANWTATNATQNDGTATLTAAAAVTSIGLSAVVNGANGYTVKAAAATAAVTISGSQLNDNIVGSANADSIIGGSGDDTIDGGAGDDTITGGAGADSIIGGSGNDSLAGGLGNDTIRGGLGANIIDATGGSDIIYVDAGDIINNFENGDSVVVNSGGVATINLSGTYIATATTTNAGTATINMAAGSLGVDMTSAGGTNGWAINGTASGEAIIGSNQNDTLTGADGADNITGADGADNITGGAGDDAVVLTDTDNAVDTLIFGDSYANNGSDTITGFTSGEDKADVSAFETAGATVDLNGATITITSGTVYYLTGQAAGAADSVAASITAMNNAATITDNANTAWVMISDDNSTALYEWTGDAQGDEATGDTLNLVATFDSALIGGDLQI